MKTYIKYALAITFLLSGYAVANPADSDPMYLKAIETKNATVCSWPQNLPKVTTFKNLHLSKSEFDKLMREKIEIVKREEIDQHPKNDEGKSQQAKELDSLFTPEAIAEDKRDEKYHQWDLAARSFYYDQDRFDGSELVMNNTVDKIKNALRLFHDDRKYYGTLTSQPLDEYVNRLAKNFNQDCKEYLILAKSLTLRDEKLSNLRRESKKPWMNPKLHLPCAIRKTVGCLE